MNVNGSSEHNGTISSYNPFSSIYSITVDVYNNQLTKLKASFSFINNKLYIIDIKTIENLVLRK